MRTFQEFIAITEGLKPLPLDKMSGKVERIGKQVTGKLKGPKPDILGASKLTARAGNIAGAALGKPNPRLSVTRVRGGGGGGAFGNPLVKPIETGETPIVRQSRERAQRLYGGRGV